jgi:hypothetical protein
VEPDSPPEQSISTVTAMSIKYSLLNHIYQFINNFLSFSGNLHPTKNTYKFGSFNHISSTNHWNSEKMYQSTPCNVEKIILVDQGAQSEALKFQDFGIFLHVIRGASYSKLEYTRRETYDRFSKSATVR